MRKNAVLLCLLFLSVLLPILPQKAVAGNLTSTFIRLERQAISTSTGGLVCTTTPSSDNGVENSLQIVFPTGFNVNQTASNWTVDAINLPAGSTPWPGISTATAVLGHIVTFPSSNLSPSTQYCFNFASSNTLTTPSSAGSYPGTVRTRNLGNSTIDSIDIGLGIVQNDGINVTATVPATPSDFQANLSLVTPHYGTYAQNTAITYELTYGSYLNNSTGITVEADWTGGGGLVDYVVGSATDAYGSSSPIVDIVNKKITWTIAPIPAGMTNQSVTFELKTNNSYTVFSPVNFSVSGRVLGPGTQTANSTVTLTYLNLTHQDGSLTPTCTPASCPTSVPTTTQPATTPIISKLPLINQIEIRSISASQATIFINTNKPTNAKVNYGTSETNLPLSISSETTSQNHTINLSDLKPKTRYFFKVTVTDLESKSATSDLFIIETAEQSQAPKALKNSIVITSLDVQLTNAIPIEGVLPNVIIPTDSTFAFRFVTDSFENIKSIKGILRNDNVLGVNSAYASTDSRELLVTEISPGQYVGKFEGSPSKGNYKLYLNLQDYSGNLSEQEIADIYIVEPLRIINAANNSGIENAKITLYYYNPRTKIYELISPNITSIQNPNKSDFRGVVNAILPEGKYRATVTVLGFDIKTIEFEVKPGIGGYPNIELQPQPFNISTYTTYSIQNASDAIDLLVNYIDNFKVSGRFLELVTLGVIILFIALSLFQLSKIFGIPVLLLPLFAIYHFVSLFYKPKHTHFVQGKIIDISLHTPVEGVLLHFAYSNGKVFAHTRSNSNGDFTVTLKKIVNVKISLSKKGYDTFSKTISADDLADKLTFAISKSEKPDQFGLSTIAWYFNSITNALFESFLIITIIVELIFAQQFGFLKVLPAIIISIGNFLLWALHARPKKAVKSRA